METGLLLIVGAFLGGGFIGALLMSLAAMSHRCEEREQQLVENAPLMTPQQ
jgi:hypothetical protein